MDISPSVTRYRRDIEGLRALAVILVILFHAGVKALPSGFIGVDIFFVISGYLITGIILKQMQEDRFTLSSFFTSRLWRIQPALITVSFLTLLVASALYIIPDYLLYLKSAKYSSLFLSNQFFAKQSSAYASPESASFPLLHTWSLSVEWQWYLFLPLILLSIAFVLKRMTVTDVISRSRDLKVLLAAIGVTVILTGASMFIAHHHPGESYYFLMSRAFEFSSGGTIVLLNRWFKRSNTSVLRFVSFLSLISLIGIACQNDIIDGYPNVWSVAVVIFTGIILFAGYYENNSEYRALSLPPMVFTGRLSYSLYLWHWPVFAFCHYLGVNLEGARLSAALGLILLLSFLSFYAIETPLRKVRLSFIKSFVILVIMPLIVFNALYVAAEKNNGFPARLGAEYAHQQNTIEEYLKRSGNRSRCLEFRETPETCQAGDLNASKTALIIGDSSSNQFWGFFDVLGKDAHIKMTALSAPTCLALPGIWQFDWWIHRNTTYDECHKRTLKFYDYIRDNHYDYVIIGDLWANYSSTPNLINKLGDKRSVKLSRERMNIAIRKALNEIVSSGARPVFLKTIFPMPSGYQKCVARQAVLRNDFIHSECNNLRDMGHGNAYVTGLFSELLKEYPSLMFINPRDIQCPNGKCMSQLNSIPLYRDVGHITDYVSYHFGHMYLERFGNPFKLN